MSEASISEASRAAAEEQIRALQREVKYDLRDFTVDYLVKQFRDDLFFIPSYQRQFIWRPSNKSNFIESVILGLPIPMLFVADMTDGRLEIVDGAQRIQTLEEFLGNDLRLGKLSLLTNLTGFRFSDLAVSQQRKFQTRALRIVVLEEGTSEDIRLELFYRINTQSVKARGSEIRRGTYQGPFIDFIKICAANSEFRRLCPISINLLKRREDEELVTRFFCYSDSYINFRHDVDRFIDAYVRSHRDDAHNHTRGEEFERMLSFVAAYFPNGFAKSKSATATPRVRFEAISVGVNLALRELPNLIPVVPPTMWLESTEFQELTTTHASNSGPRLRSRIEFVRDKLLGK